MVVIEDHPLMRKGIAEVIERDDELHLVGVFDSVEGYDRVAPAAELCVLDLHLPGMQGPAAVAHVVEQGLRVLVLSAAVARTDVVDALSAGALGYVAKDADEGEIRRALHTVAAGHSYVAPTLASQLLETETSAPELTPREREVLELVAEGASDKTIARELGLSLNTVHSHLDRIRDKTGRRRRAELARLAVDLGVTKRE
ncbi:MAG TPA: response regulator transcription factor [Acidimicrobiia bacterium]